MKSFKNAPRNPHSRFQMHTAHLHCPAPHLHIFHRASQNTLHCIEMDPPWGPWRGGFCHCKCTCWPSICTLGLYIVLCAVHACLGSNCKSRGFGIHMKTPCSLQRQLFPGNRIALAGPLYSNGPSTCIPFSMHTGVFVASWYQEQRSKNPRLGIHNMLQTPCLHFQPLRHIAEEPGTFRYRVHRMAMHLCFAP